MGRREARGSRRAPADHLWRGRPAAGARGQLAAGSRRQAGPRAPADPDRQQHLRHAARGEERARAGRPCPISSPPSTRPSCGCCRKLTGPPNEAYFVYPEELRSSKRISVFRDFLLRKVAESRLELRLLRVVAECLRQFDSIALFADEPKRIPGGDEARKPRYSGHAILHRGKFPGPNSLKRVSGTCARKEGLRTLTSPRREASLFKLGRTFWFGQFLLATPPSLAQKPESGCSGRLRLS